MRKLVLVVAFVLVIHFALFAQRASAETVIIGASKSLGIPSVSTETSVDFFVDRVGADEGTDLLVGNFQVRLELVGSAAGSLLKVLGVGPAMEHPQAFALDQMLMPSSTTAFAATFNFEAPFGVSDGDGLLAVRLGVEPGAIGGYQLRILTGMDDTQFTDPVDFQTPLAFSVQHSTITIVPEPSSLFSMASGAALLLLWHRHRNSILRRRCSAMKPPCAKMKSRGTLGLAKWS